MGIDISNLHFFYNIKLVVLFFKCCIVCVMKYIVHLLRLLNSILLAFSDNLRNPLLCMFIDLSSVHDISWLRNDIMIKELEPGCVTISVIILLLLNTFYFHMVSLNFFTSLFEKFFNISVLFGSLCDPGTDSFLELKQDCDS